MELTEHEALRAYARMMNSFKPNHLEPHLAEDFTYESQSVLSVLESMQQSAPIFSESAIDSSTIQAYLETEYQVHAEPGFKIRVGQANADLLSAHVRQATDCSAFLTACNPFSMAFDAADNSARQDALAKELTRRSLVFVPGVGKHPSNKWPGEESFLVFGLILEEAKTLGTRLEQNGLVWSGADAVPQLILLR